MSIDQSSVQLRPGRLIGHAIYAISTAVPSLRPKLVTGFTRLMYSGISMMLKPGDSAFLNYGFTSIDANAPKLPLDPADEADRYPIQLYHRIASAWPIEGKDVVEVGCGRGGGASFIVRYLKPASYIGIDLSQRAIDMCRRRHQFPNLKFMQGNAEHLPLPSKSCDVVLNVESSHCYPSFERFAKEVSRVLRPDGRFLFADLRERTALPELRASLQKLFEIIEEEPINRQIVSALELDSGRRVALIRQRAPKCLYAALDTFAGVQGSPILDSFVSGERQYVRFVLKPRLLTPYS
ncbi:MAG: class I SAM-dependent methyltransferase [Bryobacterales bacterium]|nr:class I SAM-dependent methyltransferase [Bryobacterales bacterium]